MSTEITINQAPEAEKAIGVVSATAISFSKWAASLVITSEAERDQTIERVAEVKKALKAAKDWKEQVWKPVKNSADHLASLVNPTISALEAAEKMARDKAANFEFARQQEERAKAEAARRAAEEQALEEARQREAEAAAEAARVLEASAKREEELRAAGKDAIADAVAAQREQSLKDVATEADEDISKSFAVASKVEKIAKTVKTDSGVSFTVRTVWTGEVVDAALVPREYLMVDQAKINAAVKSGVREIAGVKISEVAQGASR